MSRTSGMFTWPPWVWPASVRVARFGRSGNTSGSCARTTSGARWGTSANGVSAPTPGFDVSPSPTIQSTSPPRSTEAASFSSTSIPHSRSVRRRRARRRLRWPLPARGGPAGPWQRSTRTWSDRRRVAGRVVVVLPVGRRGDTRIVGLLVLEELRLLDGLWLLDLRLLDDRLLDEFRLRLGLKLCRLLFCFSAFRVGLNPLPPAFLLSRFPEVLRPNLDRLRRRQQHIVGPR